MRKFSKELFDKAEKTYSSIERLPPFLKHELGLDLFCEKCKNTINFQIFCTTDLIAINGIVDDNNKIWRIENPSFGPLTIKNVKCLNCGLMAEKKDFIK